MVLVGHSGNDEIRTRALGNNGKVEDRSEVSYVKMRTKAWSLELSSQREKMNQFSPLPLEIYICSHLLLKYA